MSEGERRDRRLWGYMNTGWTSPGGLSRQENTEAQRGEGTHPSHPAQGGRAWAPTVKAATTLFPDCQSRKTDVLLPFLGFVEVCRLFYLGMVLSVRGAYHLAQRIPRIPGPRKACGSRSRGPAEHVACSGTYCLMSSSAVLTGSVLPKLDPTYHPIAPPLWP